MGSLSPQLYYHHHHQQQQEENEYYNALSKSMSWFEEEEEEENNVGVENLSSITTVGSGYLEDVLFHYSISKRRRLLSPSPPPLPPPPPPPPPQDFWTWPSNSLHSLPYLTHCQEIMETPDDEGMLSSAAASGRKESSSSSDIIGNNSQWTPNYVDGNEKGDLSTMFPPSAEEKRKKEVMSKVVYPFALVKPCGFEEGDDVATLNDINRRILMPPTRPVRHPVGDFACRPIVSPRGPGLSGKTVVAFTRVHTQGRGTITIVRTRG